MSSHPGFVRLGDLIVPLTRVTTIDAHRLQRDGVVEVHLDRGPSITLSGGEAFDLILRVDPDFLEGRRFRWRRTQWAIHNLIAHPLLQLLAWSGHLKLGLRIHDATIPRPRRSPE